VTQRVKRDTPGNLSEKAKPININYLMIGPPLAPSHIEQGGGYGADQMATDIESGNRADAPGWEGKSI
jgi:hypothetical protein